MKSRISQSRLIELESSITPRDHDALTLLRDHRFLTSLHIKDLLHAQSATASASARAAQRQLRKLAEYGLVSHLPRRIGGWQGGQAQTVWHLTEPGHRLLDMGAASNDGPIRHRFRYREPSQYFLAHALRVADVRVVLEQISRTSTMKLTKVQTEPACWREWTGAHGVMRTLKPDLYTELSDPTFDYLLFIEADMDSEHMPVLLRKAEVYQAYHRSGDEQARHGGVFPLTLWVTPNERRAEQIMRAIHTAPSLDGRLHQAVSIADLASHLAATSIDSEPSRDGSKAEGGDHE